MGIVFPSEKISARWNGALQCRLRRAPLEEFLSARQLKLARPGPAQVSDNLCRAAVWLVEAMTAETLGEEPDVAALACAVSHGLAAPIDEVCHWRVAALVSGCRLLTPRYGEKLAARHAAAAVRKYHRHYLLLGTAGELDVVRAAARSALRSQPTSDGANQPDPGNRAIGAVK
jgi:hypothetical protein